MLLQRHTEAGLEPCTDDDCVIVEGLKIEDRKMKVRKIGEVTGTAKSPVHDIISDLNFTSLGKYITLKNI
jgi:hypothetical protein